MKSIVLDSFGGLASITCFMHCLILSVVPSALSNIDLVATNNELLEWSFFSFAMVFALISAGFSFFKHRKMSVMLAFGAGISVLTMGRLSEVFSFEGGGVLSIIGGFTLFAAHMMSIRCCNDTRES